MSIEMEIAALGGMSCKELREKYRLAFDASTNSRNAAWLRKRIAWRIQANAQGSLTERARNRAALLADEADLRQRPPADHSAGAIVKVMHGKPKRDPRLPQAGTILRRTYKGTEVQVEVLENGFRYEGKEYNTLSAVATDATGTRWNGFLFFGLQEKDKK